MTASRRRRPWTAAVVAVAALAVVLVGVLPTTNASYTQAFQHPTDTVSTVADYTPTTFPYRDSFSGGAPEWRTSGGCWSTVTTFGYGKYLETCGGSGGAEAVTGNPAWTDYTLQGDVQVNSGSQAGLLFRVTGPTADGGALRGYSASISADDQALVLARTDGGASTELARKTITSGIGKGNFYHLVVQAVGCTSTVWQTTVGANTWTSITYTDPPETCHTAGAIGLRDQSSTAGFRFVSATAGGTTATASATAPWNSTLTTATFWDGSPGTTYGGTWTFDGQRETIGDDPQSDQGDKDVLNRTWTDMTMTGDVRMTGRPTAGVGAGFVVRVSDPAVGLDALRGWSVGISGSRLEVGRQQYGSFEPSGADLRRGPVQNEWWHLTVAVTGCTLTATASPSAGGSATQVATTFTDCNAATGAVGLRTHGVTAEWRNIAVTPR